VFADCFGEGKAWEKSLQVKTLSQRILYRMNIPCIEHAMYYYDQLAPVCPIWGTIFNPLKVNS